MILVWRQMIVLMIVQTCYKNPNKSSRIDIILTNKLQSFQTLLCNRSRFVWFLQDDNHCYEGNLWDLMRELGMVKRKESENLLETFLMHPKEY